MRDTLISELLDFILIILSEDVFTIEIVKCNSQEYDDVTRQNGAGKEQLI